MTQKDIVSVKIQDKHISAGLKYARKSWTYTFNRMGKANIYYKMQKIVIGVTAQECFIDIFKKKQKKYTLKPKQKWYEINRFDLSANGTLFDLKTGWIDKKREKFKSISRNHSILLKFQACMSEDQLYSRRLSEDDVFIFAFLAAENKYIKSDEFSNIALFPEKHKSIIHGFWDFEFLKPNKWRYQYPKQDHSLGIIKISSNNKDDKGKTFVLGGTSADREFHIETLTMNSNGVAKSVDKFYQLFFIQIDEMPQGIIRVECSDSSVKEIIKREGGFGAEKGKLLKNGWEDIWLYNAELYLVGFLSKREFMKKHKTSKRFSSPTGIYQYPAVLVDTAYVNVTDLHPIKQIL